MVIEASRRSGLSQLEGFLPKAGDHYQQRRNFDLGPGAHRHVSMLSPYLSHRLLSEWEVISAAVTRHGLKQAQKFVDEVVWRAYWKGWLAHHPQVWRNYAATVAEPLSTAEASAVAKAEAGQTGVDCFDSWAAELVQTGYLHNHARMWFASIWVFTLGLSWMRGADFFIRHLIDGDPASNTLSWRWVAGLHTRGKRYVASEANIARFTENRFPATPGLAAAGPELTDQPFEKITPDLSSTPLSPGPAAVLLTECDLLPLDLPAGVELAAVGGYSTRQWRSPKPLGAVADDFSAAALAGAVKAQSEQVMKRQPDNQWEHTAAPVFEHDDVERAVDWVRSLGVATVVMSRPQEGPAADGLALLETALKNAGIGLAMISRPWDQQCWPHCTKGFFRLKREIPALLAQAGIGTAQA